MIICFYEYQKQPWVDWYKRSYCIQWTFPILRAPWPSYMNDVCKWLYAFMNIKNSLVLTDTKGHIAFNDPIPFWGLHGLAIWMMFVNDYMLLWISKNQTWVISKAEKNMWYPFHRFFPILRSPRPKHLIWYLLMIGCFSDSGEWCSHDQIKCYEKAFCPNNPPLLP